MAHLDFRKDLVLGNKGEVVIKEYLESKGCKFIRYNYDNKYDLLMEVRGQKTTYEIKTDVFCSPEKDSGNMFVEYKCRGKASGIETSQAAWFVTFYPKLNEIWFIKTSELKELINTNNFREIKNGGDPNSATHGYLIKRAAFKEHFKVYSILSNG